MKWVKASERLPDRADVYFIKFIKTGEKRLCRFLSMLSPQCLFHLRRSEIEWLDESNNDELEFTQDNTKPFDKNELLSQLVSLRDKSEDIVVKTAYNIAISIVAEQLMVLQAELDTWKEMYAEIRIACDKNLIAEYVGSNGDTMSSEEKDNLFREIVGYLESIPAMTGAYSLPLHDSSLETARAKDAHIQLNKAQEAQTIKSNN